MLTIFIQSLGHLYRTHDKINQEGGTIEHFAKLKRIIGATTAYEQTYCECTRLQEEQSSISTSRSGMVSSPISHTRDLVVMAMMMMTMIKYTSFLLCVLYAADWWEREGQHLVIPLQKVRSEPIADVLRKLFIITPIGFWENERCNAATACGNRLLTNAPDWEKAAGQADFTRHGNVLSYWKVECLRKHGCHHDYSRTWPA